MRRENVTHKENDFVQKAWKRWDEGKHHCGSVRAICLHFLSLVYQHPSKRAQGSSLAACFCWDYRVFGSVLGLRPD